MANVEDPRNPLRDVPVMVWVALAAIVMAVAVVLHGSMPRYGFSADGQAIVVYDRWTGRFQRTIYDAQGTPTLTQVVKPF